MLNGAPTSKYCNIKVSLYSVLPKGQIPVFLKFYCEIAILRRDTAETRGEKNPKQNISELFVSAGKIVWFEIRSQKRQMCLFILFICLWWQSYSHIRDFSLLPPTFTFSFATAPLNDQTIKLPGQGHWQTKRAANADCWRDAKQLRKQIQTR